MLSKKANNQYKKPSFEIPATAKTREEVGAYVDQYVKDSVAWQEREFQKWKLQNIESPINSKSKLKGNQRRVLCWSMISFGLLIFLMLLGYVPTPPVFSGQKLNGSPNFYAMLGLLITAPIAYAIWTIRDENAAQTLENARKDTNLKDFQRLIEWASGFHLPENKIVSLDKTITKETETSSETITTTETYSPPKDAQQVSRRMGAESLQVAAIYQLQAFMRGAYGEQFMKPAFYVLFSMWQTKMKPIMDKYTPKMNPAKMHIIIDQIQNQLVTKAIHDSIIADNGMYLRLFCDALPNSCLAGLRIRHGKLNLAGLDLHGIDLRFCDLGSLHLDGCKLDGADLSHIIISGTLSLIKANSTSDAHFSNLSGNIINCHFAFFDNCNFIDFFSSNMNAYGCKITTATKFGNSNPAYQNPFSATQGIDYITRFINYNERQKEWLDAGAILVDSETGEPIKPE